MSNVNQTQLGSAYHKYITIYEQFQWKGYMDTFNNFPKVLIIKFSGELKIETDWTPHLSHPDCDFNKFDVMLFSARKDEDFLIAIHLAAYKTK